MNIYTKYSSNKKEISNMLDLKNMGKHVDHLNETWKYRYDTEQYGSRDHWTIMKEPPYEGDCEDYALTLLWLMSGKSMVKFWFNIITMRVQLRRVITKNGGGHVVLRIGNLYADNWTKKFVSWEEMEKLGHKKFLWMYDPLLVVTKMIMATVAKLLKKS